jgi:hypothetical protein
MFVMRLAELKAKPDANHANAHPMQDWSCQICNPHRAMHPPADLVSNPTPPGQITREWASLVNGQLGREIDGQVL